MHIRDKHNGKAEVLRHPTKKELLIRAETDAARIATLEAQLEEMAGALEAYKIAEAAAADTASPDDYDYVFETWAMVEAALTAYRKSKETGDG